MWTSPIRWTSAAPVNASVVRTRGAVVTLAPGACPGPDALPRPPLKTMVTAARMDSIGSDGRSGLVDMMSRMHINQALSGSSFESPLKCSSSSG